MAWIRRVDAQWSGRATTRSVEWTGDHALRAALARYTAAGCAAHCAHCPQHPLPPAPASHLLDGDGEVLGAARRAVDRRKGAIGREVAPRPEDLAIVAHALALGVVRLARAVVDERAQRLGVASAWW